MKKRILLATALFFACSSNGKPAPSGADGGSDGGTTGMMCPHAKDPAPPSGVCTVTAGQPGLLITGEILLPGNVLHGGQVAVDATGNITCVDCDCTQAAAGATAIDCPKGVISPGLINAHDHLTYAQNAPPADTGERYDHRNQWRTGEGGHTKIKYASDATGPQVTWGELRFVMGGATSTVGSGGAPGLLRNLDEHEDDGNLGEPDVLYDVFPLGSTTPSTLACTGYTFAETQSSIATIKAFEPHIAEGVDQVARNEFVCSSMSGSGAQDLAQPQSAFIHSAALQTADYQAMAAAKTRMIWSPRSNLSLYGNTAPITLAVKAGVTIALGSDWTLTGSMSLLRELACADSFNSTYLNHALSDEDLWLMVTKNAALATGTDDKLGLVATGHLADLAIFDGTVNVDYRAVVAAQPQDVVLVMRAGKPLYGDAAVLTGLAAPGCDAVSVCGAAKSVCLMSEVAFTYSALQTAGGTTYPAFFCGTPTNEPSCTPKRPTAVNGSTIYTGVPSATDSDGDGIPDATDSCPKIFNPIRPVDNGKQPDC